MHADEPILRSFGLIRGSQGVTEPRLKVLFFLDAF